MPCSSNAEIRDQHPAASDLGQSGRKNTRAVQLVFLQVMQ
jgi:hypothetical protein